jgi:N-acyl-D-amino-acid deacylase
VNGAFDLLIAGGRVCDGTGAPARRADVGVRGDRIAAIGDLAGAQASRTVDAAGRLVAPGFIDIHSHSDESVLLEPRLLSTLHQGVTTVVAGNCGSSSAPAIGLGADEVDRRLARHAMARTWTSFDEYLAAVERARPAINFCSLVGHGRLRQAVIGGARRAPSGGELSAMRALLASSLEEGAVGLASGLIYPPSSYADGEELTALGAVVARYGGLYASHVRNEGSRLVEAVEEGIAVGRRSGARVQLSHHKAAGRRNWGRVTMTLDIIARARDEGVDVAADQYPYTASSTGLAVVVPDWAHEGGTDALLERLRDPEMRRRIEADETETERSWEAIVIARARRHPDLVGRSIAEVAADRGLAPLAAACDLLLEEDGAVPIVIHSMCEEDVRTVLGAGFVCVGSDSSAVAVDGPLSEGQPHPRAYGCFPRVLGRYVRELGVLPAEEAIRKMTSLTATRLGLRARGEVREGWFADLVVFDPDRVADAATFERPHRYAVGIEAVIVNGAVTLERGRVSDGRHGRVLRRGRDLS